jgi:hypothetical protein
LLENAILVPSGENAGVPLATPEPDGELVRFV